MQHVSQHHDLLYMEAGKAPLLKSFHSAKHESLHLSVPERLLSVLTWWLSPACYHTFPVFAASPVCQPIHRLRLPSAGVTASPLPLLLFVLRATAAETGRESRRPAHELHVRRADKQRCRGEKRQKSLPTPVHRSVWSPRCCLSVVEAELSLNKAFDHEMRRKFFCTFKTVVFHSAPLLQMLLIKIDGFLRFIRSAKE